MAGKSTGTLLPTDVFSWHLPSGLGPLPTEEEVGLGYSQDHSPEQGRSLCLGVGVGGPKAQSPLERCGTSGFERLHLAVEEKLSGNRRALAGFPGEQRVPGDWSSGSRGLWGGMGHGQAGLLTTAPWQGSALE